MNLINDYILFKIIKLKNKMISFTAELEITLTACKLKKRKNDLG